MNVDDAYKKQNIDLNLIMPEEKTNEKPRKIE